MDYYLLLKYCRRHCSLLSPTNGYFSASAKLALSLILTKTLTLTQTLTLIITLILTLIPTLTQMQEKHYFASRGKIATS